MGISLGILFGIIAMISWGVADFFVAKAVRKSSVFKTLLWVQIVIVMLFLLISPWLIKFQNIPLNLIVLTLITAFIGVVSLLAFYKGMQVGYVSIVSPISSAYAAITVILSLIFLSEKLTALQTIGVSLTISGAILTALRFHDILKLRLKNIATGAEYGAAAMIGWGVFFVFLGILISGLGWFLPILLIKITSVFYLLIYSAAVKKNISFPKDAVLFIVAIGLLEGIGLLFFGLGVTQIYTAIVTPISSAYPMITIILARIFFKETIELSNKIGVISVLAGLALLAI